MPGYEVFGDEERKALNDLFEVNGGVTFAHGFDGQRNGIYRVREFEQVFARRMGFRFVQAVSSGTAACKIAMKSLGVGPGDEVVTQSFTFIATVEAILECGATPVILDVDDTLNMDVSQLEEAITHRTKAIVPVHMMGEMTNMPIITEIANKYDVPVVEDCAQALGSSLFNVPSGKYGLMAVYSTDAGKTLNTGEGGFVATDDQNLYEMARALHDHGHAYREDTPRGLDPALAVGFNYRLTELQAAVGIAQLQKLDFIVNSQRANKALILQALAEYDLTYRRSIDPLGDLSDTLVFRWPTQDIAAQFALKLREAGLGAKNLPDAVDWHFAKKWRHMDLHGTTRAHVENWAKSQEILNSSVAIPIGVFLSEQYIKKLRECIEEVSTYV